MSATATMYRVDPTEIGWRAHPRRFVMRRSCAGGIAYVRRSACIRRRRNRRSTIGRVSHLRIPPRHRGHRRARFSPPRTSRQYIHLAEGLFPKRAEQDEFVAAVGEPRANPLALGECQAGNSFVARPQCELLRSRWCAKHEAHARITGLPANDNIVLVRVNYHESPVLSRLVRRTTYDGSRRASMKKRQHDDGCRKAADTSNPANPKNASPRPKKHQR